MEKVEKMNAVMVYPNQKAEFTQRNPYTMDMNRRNRNCYSCGDFGHLARNCRNRRTENRIGEGRRLEYRQENNRQRLIIKGGNRLNNLNGERDLIVFNQILVKIGL